SESRPVRQGHGNERGYRAAAERSAAKARSAEGAAVAPFAWSPAAGQQKMTLRNGEQNPAGLICGIPVSALSIASANPPPSGINVRL
ncbi:hypothetical protein, partial [Tatumella sp. JGM91]|uniref:hypothetical protein n=1 Tax=Tatumella sp. JGM91 TaxID=2799794 RepID=UPI001BAFADB1